MSAKAFFENKHGKTVIYQHPNVLLWLWLVVQVVNIAAFKANQPALSTLAGMLLFAWAYGELTQGESPFRKALGGIVLAVTIIMVFVKW
jgi:hypothetical protein